jgi:hypothetical protein
VISLNKLPDQFSSSLAGRQFNQFVRTFRPASCSSIQARGCKLTERIVDMSGSTSASTSKALRRGRNCRSSGAFCRRFRGFRRHTDSKKKKKLRLYSDRVGVDSFNIAVARGKTGEKRRLGGKLGGLLSKLQHYVTIVRLSQSSHSEGCY